jgi:hypothetical protein
MQTGRRFFLSNFAMVLAGAQSLLAVGQRQTPPPRPPRMPDGTATDGPFEDSTSFPQPDPKEQLKQSQKNLRRNADRLVQLAKELKDEADKTEQTDVLSLSLVHKAEEVEKLARQIKDLIRAA